MNSYSNSNFSQLWDEINDSLDTKAVYKINTFTWYLPIRYDKISFLISLIITVSYDTINLNIIILAAHRFTALVIGKYCTTYQNLYILSNLWANKMNFTDKLDNWHNNNRF